MVKEKLKTVRQDEERLPGNADLVLFNDNFNTFDHVIETLIDVCGHDALQAEQCALVAHINGKCTIMSGLVEELKPIGEEMTRRELTVTIN